MGGPTQVRLDEALTQLVDHVAGVCDTARNGGLLTGLTRVVVGDRSRARPDPPYLWVIVGAATATHARAMHETWEAAVMLNAYVASEEPEDGWMDAMVWAARARSAVLADRVPLGFVEDLQSAELGVLGHFRAGRRFGAYARVNARLSLVEPSPEEPAT